MNLPGSNGEHFLQDKFNTRERALAFYEQQVLDHLNPKMIEFISVQTMVFIGTADAKGNAIAPFVLGTRLCPGTG